MVNVIYRFFVKKNYLDMMLNIYFDKITKLRDLARKTGMDYAHLSTVSQALEQDNMISREMEQNSFNISLTKKGKAFCLHLVEIKKFIEASQGMKESLEAVAGSEHLGDSFEQAMDESFNKQEESNGITKN